MPGKSMRKEQFFNGVGIMNYPYAKINLNLCLTLYTKTNLYRLKCKS